MPSYKLIPKTPLLIAILSILSSALNAQIHINTRNIRSNELPVEIKYKGRFTSALRWTDKTGDYITLITETGEYPATDPIAADYLEGHRGAAIYAYNYLLKDDSVIQTWKTFDEVKDCPVDIVASFVKDAFQVTDLDKNGIAEIWLMYRTVCRGDVSPADMKIIMHEGSKKYAVRGTNRVKLSATEFEGGTNTFNDTFLKGPQEFIEFAKKLWDANINENWE